MTQTKQRSEARVGDMIEVAGHRVGEAARVGEILEVLGSADHVHYRVRWEDGRETTFYPGEDVVVRAART
jgi:rRNA processing protein Gar1